MRPHSTRNTSIRTRKIRGEDSLLSSISIAEREEEPEGITMSSIARNRCPGPPIWHSGAGKKGHQGWVWGGIRELRGETGLRCNGHFINLRCLSQSTGFLHDRGPRPANASCQLRTSLFFLLPSQTGVGHMSFVSKIIGTAERVPLPDLVIRAAVQRLCSRTATRLAGGDAESDTLFADEMAARAIAGYTDEAKAPHHELPAAFFARVLGPSRKYSCCYYKEPETTLQEAEEEALRQTVAHADVARGQSILELGCGWGSLSLWMARQFPNSQVTAVSNSQAQREYIEWEAAVRGLKNLRVAAADTDVFDPKWQFDRIVSVEMFEHIVNWRQLMTRVRSCLAPDGRFFMRIYTH